MTAAGAAQLLSATGDANLSALQLGSVVEGRPVRWTWVQDQHRLLDSTGPLYLIVGPQDALAVTCLDPDGMGGWGFPETLQSVSERLRGLRPPSPIPTRPKVALVPDRPMPHWKDIEH